ncbi:preprotein translocase subunit SecY [Alistipes sp. OttesenSCG-928-B03]|nr:preprotein translocase subunit SecY [Alistipes sp. OttesenSCG-928-B03]
MKKLIQTVKNIWKIEELRNKLVYTFGLILIFRLGCHVVLPGINPLAIAKMGQGANAEGLRGLLDMFSGGAFNNASIFALGVMPYITASIVIQLLGMVFPYFQKLQKEGESGRRKMNQLTRYLTIVVLCLQVPAYLTDLGNRLASVPGAMVLTSASGGASFWYYLSAAAVLVAGTMFVMWLGEKITDKGIGNGVSLLIMVGILARLPQAIIGEVNTRLTESTGGLVMLVVELVLWYLVYMATIALVQAVRRIPVQYTKRMVGNKMMQGARQYIPLKINAANVMPIIFAQALMMLPMMFWPTGAMTNVNGFWYNFIFAVLIIAFTYFYTAITVNPNMMAEDLKRNGGFIPGIKPGKQTVNYIDNIMTRITLPGSIFLAIVAILPAFAVQLGISQQFAYFYGGTSLLIMVGVVLDTLKQIESYLLLRHYDGLMKTGRIKGRQG